MNWSTIILICLVILFILYYLGSTTQEDFLSINPDICPETLIRYNNVYLLYRNNSLERVFSNYDDYLRYWQGTQLGYLKKDAICKPLLPVSSTNTLTGTIVDPDTVYPREFNLEHFVGRKAPYTDRTKEKDELINKINAGYYQYMLSNPKCMVRIYKKDYNFYKVFQRSYEYHTKRQFERLLGYIPQKATINDMTLEELDAYYKIIDTLPECTSMIDEYYNAIGTENPIKDPDGVMSNNIKNYSEFTAIDVPINTGKIDIVTNLDGITNIEAQLLPQEPSPSFIHQVDEINKLLKDISFKLDSKLTINNGLTKEDNWKEEVANKFRKLEQEIKDNETKNKPIPNRPRNDVDAILVDKQYYYNPNAPNKSLNENVSVDYTTNFNFPYTPKYNYNHEQPAKEIAESYGWSIIPPAFWSVPQERPPVCIPEKGTAATVLPVYDVGTPLNAMEVNKAYPKIEYKEDYNPDYFYPGYITKPLVPSKENILYSNNPVLKTY